MVTVHEQIASVVAPPSASQVELKQIFQTSAAQSKRLFIYLFCHLFIHQNKNENLEHVIIRPLQQIDFLSAFLH